MKKPFAFENELKEKTERLNALNIELNLNEKDKSVIDDEPEQDDGQPEKKMHGQGALNPVCTFVLLILGYYNKDD
ncbi:hypothetical protein WKT07_08685 [Mediterraneibacter sp. HCN-7094]